jgi:hypothetical protein
MEVEAKCIQVKVIIEVLMEQYTKGNLQLIFKCRKVKHQEVEIKQIIQRIQLIIL